MKLVHTRIVTQNVGRLAEFYEKLTGINSVGSEDYREFTTPSGAFAVSSQEKMNRHGAAATLPASNRSTVLDFEVNDVEAERNRLREVVDEFVMEPTNQPWGNRSMLFRDPDGNLINFFTPMRDMADQSKSV